MSWRSADISGSAPHARGQVVHGPSGQVVHEFDWQRANKMIEQKWIRIRTYDTYDTYNNLYRTWCILFLIVSVCFRPLLFFLVVSSFPFIVITRKAKCVVIASMCPLALRSHPSAILLEKHPRTACPNWSYPRTGLWRKIGVTPELHTPQRA